MSCLVVPGLSCSGPGHWQTIWEECRTDCRRVELGCWDDPTREAWIDGLDRAVRSAPDGCVLVAHSLGCLAVAWWAQGRGRDIAGRVKAALLVAPPDVDRAGADVRLHRFAPTPHGALPFPAILVASRDDPYCTIARARVIARGLGAELVDIGEAGHINARSGLGRWPFGERLLNNLLARPPAHLNAGPAAAPVGQGGGLPDMPFYCTGTRA